MKLLLSFCIVFVSLPGFAQINTPGGYVLLRVPHIDGETTYEVVSRDQYSARQMESRKMDAAVKQAYNDVKQEWVDERKEKARAAVEKNREDSRNRRTDDRNRSNNSIRTRTTHRRESFNLGSFPLKAPKSMAVSYLGTFPNEQAAQQRQAQIVSRDQKTAQRTLKLKESQLARPSTSRKIENDETDRGVGELTEKLAQRTEEVLAEIAAQGDGTATQKHGLKSSGLRRPAQGTTTGKRLGEGLQGPAKGTTTGKRLGEGLKGGIGNSLSGRD